MTDLVAKPTMPKPQRQENHQGTEAPGTGFLCQAVHDKQHVQHQPANPEVQRNRLELFNTHAPVPAASVKARW